jgi:hypothetical protein
VKLIDRDWNLWVINSLNRVIDLILDEYIYLLHRVVKLLSMISKYNRYWSKFYSYPVALKVPNYFGL